MSSHREAPEISKDPVADSTDLYAFVSPDEPDTVTLIANYVPLEGPAGGPNFYEFGENVLYEISVDNDSDGLAEIVFQFRFENHVANPDTFLYNTGPIQSLGDPNWNRRQTYSVTRVDINGEDTRTTVLGTELASPPCNIGPLSTPNYGALAAAAVHELPGDVRVFAGQRAEGFYVDLGSIFDLGILRPFEELHTTFGLQNTGLGKMAAGVNATKELNVHSIAIQIPKEQLTGNGRNPHDVADQGSVIGVWTSAYRQKVRVHDDSGQAVWAGPYVQVSRLGNPLINEVIIPMGKKDFWNTQAPVGDSQFAPYYVNPELAQLLPVLYPPPVFPNLAAYNAGPPAPNRADIVAILLTGIPSGLINGFQNFTGPTQADLLRLNMAIPPAGSPKNTGLLGGDVAGFPNGRRVFDDVATIELRALAGAVLSLVAKFTPDAAAGAIHQGLTSDASDLTALGTENYLGSFPYLGVPLSGFKVPAA